MPYSWGILRNLSTFFLRTLREDPADAEVNSHELLVCAGYIRRSAPSVYTWLPPGLHMLCKIEDIVREEMDATGTQEVCFPDLIPTEFYRAANRWEEYGPTLSKLDDRRDDDYLLVLTHEEMFTLLVKNMYPSYKDLSAMLYQIQTKYRDETHPHAGLVRSRGLVTKDAYSFDIDDEGLNAFYQAERDIYERIFQRLGLRYVIVSVMNGAMDDSRSKEFLHPSPVGEDTLVASPGGHVVNAKAVTAPVPEAQGASDAPTSLEVPTLDASTIESFADPLNDQYPREDRPRAAVDTSKNIVVTLTHPDGEHKFLVVDVPGDRDVDMKYLEVAVAPAEVEMTSDPDFVSYPELVHGCIGPAALGSNSSKRVVDEGGNASGSVRYLVDPHVVEGIAWAMGANAKQYHVPSLVVGRDFTADGTIEAVEVREGDLTLNGSDPLHLKRSVKIGHIFQLGRKYAKALGLTVPGENGKIQVVTVGSYGIGVTRVMVTLAEANCDDKGLSWPAQIVPFGVHVLAAGEGGKVLEAAQSLGEELDTADPDIPVDDRRKVSAGVKFKDYELVGIPFGLVVRYSLADSEVEIHVCATDKTIVSPVKRAVVCLHEFHATTPKGE